MLKKATTEEKKIAITLKAIALCNFHTLLIDPRQVRYTMVEDGGLSFEIKLQPLTTMARTISFTTSCGAADCESVRRDQGAMVLIEAQNVESGGDVVEWTASPYVWVDENGLLSIEWGAAVV